jgi:hypothetical protein
MAKVNVWGYNVIRAGDQEEARIIASNPGVLVVISNFEQALRFKRALPSCEVVYRHYPDDKIWERMTPQKYFEQHSHFSTEGILVQVGNEDAPADLEAYGQWVLQILKMARSTSARFAVMPFSVGRPPDHDRDYNRLLPVFREMAQNPGKHAWIPHEYFNRLITDQPGQEYLIGRFTRALRACDAAGIPRPLTLIGEFGPALDMNPLNGWKNAGVDQNTVIEQMRLAARQFYVPNKVAVALFAWRPYRPFELFDLATEPGIVGEVERQSFVFDPASTAPPIEVKPFPDIPEPGDSRWKRHVVRHDLVNFRAEPRIGNNVQGMTAKDDIIHVAEGVTYPEGDMEWFALMTQDGKIGWSRRPPFTADPQTESIVTSSGAGGTGTGGQLGGVVAPPPPPPPPITGIHLEADEARAMIQRHLRQAELYEQSSQTELAEMEANRKQAERFQELARNERQQAETLQTKLSQQGNQ